MPQPRTRFIIQFEENFIAGADSGVRTGTSFADSKFLTLTAMKEHDVVQANEAPKSETGHFDGHVVTVECIFHADGGRWEPVVLIKPSWTAGDAQRIATTAEHFQDTPQDALDVAKNLAREWIADNDPSDGTVDAAV